MKLLALLLLLALPQQHFQVGEYFLEVMSYSQGKRPGRWEIDHNGKGVDKNLRFIASDYLPCDDGEIGCWKQTFMFQAVKPGKFVVGFVFWEQVGPGQKSEPTSVVEYEITVVK